MKLKTIALAVAALGATSSFAASVYDTVANGGYGVAAGNVFYISGSSAIGNIFKNVVSDLCTGGTSSIVEIKTNDTTGSASSAYGGATGRIEICTTSGVTGKGLPTGPFVVVKRDINGSFDGVGPVIDKTAIAGWPDVTNIYTVTAAQANKSFAAGALTVAPNYTLKVVPNGGMSDVDYYAWAGAAANGLFTAAAVPALPGNITYATSIVGQSIGVMVTNALYAAMQGVQKADGRIPSTCTVGDLTTAACQPTISRAEYAAIVNGITTSYVVNANLTGDAVNPINICRRVQTSGTQAISNAVFLNAPCASGASNGGMQTPKFVDFANSPTAVTYDPFNSVTFGSNFDNFGGALALFEASTTTDALNCMTNRNSGLSPIGTGADGLGNYAVGVVTTDKAPSASTAWQFVKLDNVSPNFTPAGAVDGTQRLNVVNGQYNATAELSMYYYADGSAGAKLMSALQSEMNLASKITASIPGLYSVNGSNNGANTHAAFPTVVSKGTTFGNICSPSILQE